MRPDLDQIMDELNRRIGPDSSVWLYQSSCRYYDDLQSVRADALLLCSNEFNKNERIGKVYCIKCDNNLLIKILLEMDIKIESAIFICDGCVEGGNYECTNTATCFGRSLPILREKSFILTDHGTTDGFFDVPVDALQQHSRKCHGYDSLIRHSSLWSRPIFWAVDKYHEPPTAFKIGNMRIQLVHDSIFNFLETLDLSVFFSHKPLGFGHYFELDMTDHRFWWNNSDFGTPDNVFGEYKFKGLSHYIQISKNRSQTFQNALDFAFEHKLETIGFIPFGRDRYEKTYQVIQSYSRDYPKEIVLFHLNRADYSYFYSIQRGLGP